MRIKKGNKWKVAFLILESIFELTVMFFGLTNSLVTFQVIINDLLRDMIEARDVASFIDNVMVGTEIEEEYDNIVKEEFLGVVIRPDRLKMEKEKIQKVVDWPILRNIKDVQKFLELENYYR